METKKEIRKRILSERAALTLTERLELSGTIQNRLLEHPMYLNADEIYCYVAFGDEVSTSLIMEMTWRLGKKLAVPKIINNDYMEFYYINSPEDLKEGYFKLQEPTTAEKAAGKNVLVVMPGVAFDQKGGRIGYGRGFYDTYLQKHPAYARLAVAFSVQMTDTIPTEPHDIRPELIITEGKTYRC